MIKAAFFDIDGTLLSFKTHKLAASTKSALIELRSRGVKCFIASGRPEYQLPPCIRHGFDGFDGFDAYVTFTGSCCYDAEGTYFEVPIPDDDVRTVVGQVKKGLYEALVLRKDRAFVTRHTPEVCAVEKNAGLVYDEDDIERALEGDVIQFCAFLPPEDEHIVTDAATGVLTTRWCDYFCDVVPANSSKPAGIRATLERYGIAPEESIAFGDGGNDASMLQMCGIGVAMGNASPDAIAAADYVTDDVDHDGIARALDHFAELWRR